MVEQEIIRKRNYDESVDLFSKKLVEEFPVIECPVRHVFTPGLYLREITMPTESVVISEIHKTRHPFIVSKGRVIVWTELDGCVEIVAPYQGITEPGTRRVLFVMEDTVWTTCHTCTDGETVADIKERIIEKYENTLLKEMMESENFLIE